MANLLILSHDIPYPQDYSGSAVRVLPLSTALSARHNCWLATFTADPLRQAAMAAAGVFQGCTVIPAGDQKTALTRFAFLRSGHMAHRRTPDRYRSVVFRLERLLVEQRIDAVIAHGLEMSVFALGVKPKARIFDATDCITLAHRRQFDDERHRYGLISYAKSLLGELRAAYQERYSLRRFDFTCLASPVDAAFMRSLCRDVSDRVKLIPNGVSPIFLDRRRGPRRHPERAIAFWGALDFHPNTTAVRWFYDHVYRPLLRGRGIRWYIIGKEAPDDILRYGKEDPDIVVTGFIPDLPSFLENIPVMVNPMRTGGGIKNKVLEAFAIERAVVSTGMGIESIAAQPDEHYLPAETPEEFRRRIELLLSDRERSERLGSRARRLVQERYDWRSIGDSYCDIVESALNRKWSEQCP